jgi:hypothetical protein
VLYWYEFAYGNPTIQPDYDVTQDPTQPQYYIHPLSADIQGKVNKAKNKAIKNMTGTCQNFLNDLLFGASLLVSTALPGEQTMLPWILSRMKHQKHSITDQLLIFI